MAKTDQSQVQTAAADANELNRNQQMVLTIIMKDLNEIATLLYPDYEKPETGYMQVPQLHSRQYSQSFPSKEKTKTKTQMTQSQGFNALHREDPLYQATTVQDQVEYLSQKK